MATNLPNLRPVRSLKLCPCFITFPILTIDKRKSSHHIGGVKDNPISARKRMKRWRAKNLKHHRAVSAAWKARNPDWYIGRNAIQMLTAALISGNNKSKVFEDAGMTMSEWIAGNWSINCLGHRVPGYLKNGSKLVPVKNWSECGKNPKTFLAPGNFRLVQK